MDLMNSQFLFWWGKARMRQMQEEAARRALLCALRRPLSLALADLLIRLGRALARRASDYRRESPDDAVTAGRDRVVDLAR